jgi:hypothetical protein
VWNRIDSDGCGDRVLDLQRAHHRTVGRSTNFDPVCGLGCQQQLQIEGVMTVADAGGLRVSAIDLGASYGDYGAIDYDVEAHWSVRMGEALGRAGDAGSVAQVEAAEQFAEHPARGNRQLAPSQMRVVDIRV